MVDEPCRETVFLKTGDVTEQLKQLTDYDRQHCGTHCPPNPFSLVKLRGLFCFSETISFAVIDAEPLSTMNGRKLCFALRLNFFEYKYSFNPVPTNQLLNFAVQ